MIDTVKLGVMVVIADEDMDWKFERKEEARLDAMYESYEDDSED
tara:strand:- start:126 stop:257 length:132 start_codon:yes stop_codon:yes gene_type:complete